MRLADRRAGALAEALLEVPGPLVHTALDPELAKGTVIADRVGETGRIFLAGLHRAERSTLPCTWIDPEKALPWIEQRSGLTMAESQKAAIRLALVSKALATHLSL